MKTIIKTIISTALILNISILFSQVTTTINNMITVPYNTHIPNCGTIDFQSYNEMRLQFTVKLDKSIQSSVGDGNIYIYVKKNQGANKVDRDIKFIPSAFWVDNTSTGRSTITSSIDITLQSSDFDLTGGVVFAEYVSNNNTTALYPSCDFNVIRTQSPTFNITPNNVNIDCNNTSPITFSVTNVYNTSGTKTYKWEVGSNWLYNGNTAPNEITTTSNSITLTPNTFPPSNIRVATILNGTQLPFSTSNVKLTSIQNREIIGEITVCSSETLSISNLKANETVVWALSNSNIASISSTNNQAIVSANGNGIVTITATISNSCGQQVVKTKTATIGVPTDYYDAIIEVHPYPGNGGGFYLNNWTRMWMTNYPGGSNWNWTANYSMIQNVSSAQPLIKPLSTGYITVKVRKSNSCGYGSWVSKNFYITQQSGGGHHFEGID